MKPDRVWFENKDEYRFRAKSISEPVKRKIEEIANRCRGDILKMTTIAGCGHPGGSMSSIDFYSVVYSLSSLREDKIVVSHGHTSPGVYSILGNLGILDRDEVIAFFRHADGPYEGHVESHLPGIVWSTGNLGQGLSAACGFAMADKIKNRNSLVFSLMSDAEQAKGQVAEARRFASKYELNNLTVVVDYNNRQISGKVENIMPINIREDYIADGWEVIEVNGHSITELYEALHVAVNDKDSHYAIIARTVMGKGVSFIEGDETYHGKALSDEQLGRALEELVIENDTEKYRKIRQEDSPEAMNDSSHILPLPDINRGEPILYEPGQKVGNRDSFGKALFSLAKANEPGKIVVQDCDLAPSVRTKDFWKEYPGFFMQTGVSEHNAGTIAGALSTQGIHTFLADFGVFGADEMYNQQRLNAINNTKLRLVVTHCGLNVGEDGKTHQCIDYIGVFRNFPGFKLIIPADANQTDRVIRSLPDIDGNVCLVTGRAKEKIIDKADGMPFFDKDYRFEYGKTDRLRDGDDGLIISCGYATGMAVEVERILREEGINLGVINISAPLALSVDNMEDFSEYKNIYTYEDHLVYSGLGSIVGDIIARSGSACNFHSFGVKGFAPSGTYSDLFRKMGMDPEFVAGRIKETID